MSAAEQLNDLLLQRKKLYNRKASIKSKKKITDEERVGQLVNLEKEITALNKTIEEAKEKAQVHDFFSFSDI